MLIALTRVTPEQAFLLRAHVGNYSLFISGIFHENTQLRSRRGAPDLEFYEQIGRTNFQLVSSHATARRCELNDVFEGLADRFRDVRLALNQLSDQLLNLDEGEPICAVISRFLTRRKGSQRYTKKFCAFVSVVTVVRKMD